MNRQILLLAMMAAMVPLALHGQTRAGAAAGARAATGTEAAAVGGETALAANARLELPMGQVERVIAEGRARGESASAIDRAALAAHTRLNASRAALASGDRRPPTPVEIEAGASALAAGATAADLRTVRDAAPADRSVEASLTALAELRARGMSGRDAAAEVAGQLSAGASDAAVLSRARASVESATRAGAGAAARVRGGVSGAASGRAAIGGAGGSAGLGAAVGAAGSLGGGLLR